MSALGTEGCAAVAFATPRSPNPSARRAGCCCRASRRSPIAAMFFLSIGLCRTMALPTQDLPPVGGFEAIRYKRNLPARGPPGYIFFLVGAAAIAYGLYKVGDGNQKNWYGCRGAACRPKACAAAIRDAHKEKAALRERERKRPKACAGASVSVPCCRPVLMLVRVGRMCVNVSVSWVSPSLCVCAARGAGR
jgi:NADH dehydrogenase (ubiquinone) 1 alpha subcomplex subunit 13